MRNFFHPEYRPWQSRDHTDSLSLEFFFHIIYTRGDIKNFVMYVESQPNPEIGSLREQINRIDEQLVTLIAERLQLASSLGKVKKDQGIEVIDPAREAEVIETWRVLATQMNVPPELIESIIKIIIVASTSIQQK